MKHVLKTAQSHSVGVVGVVGLSAAAAGDFGMVDMTKRRCRLAISQTASRVRRTALTKLGAQLRA